MQDVEVESLVQHAGYRFDPMIGRYVVTDSAEDDVDYPTEDVAEQLGIPMDDLIRWEEEQVNAADGGNG